MADRDRVLLPPVGGGAPGPCGRAGLASLALAVLVVGAAPGGAAAAASPEPPPLLVETTPWLLAPAAARELSTRPRQEQAQVLAAVLAEDPLPETGLNELAEGAARRRRLVLEEVLSPWDDRARLLFLQGPPDERSTVDCSATFRPLEIWRYGERRLVLYRPGPEPSWEMWIPFHGKGALYTDQMRGWLEDWEALRRTTNAPRMDRRLCPDSRRVDEATGVDGLSDVQDGAPTGADLRALLGPPADRAAWAARAATTPVGPEPPALPLDVAEPTFPSRMGQRLEARLLVSVPAGTVLGAAGEGDAAEVRINVAGVVESDGELFERFRMRFPVPAASLGAEDGETDAPLPIAVTRALRPGSYVVRLRVADEVGRAETVVTRAIEVPREPTPRAADAASTEEVVATARLDEQLARRPDALALLVPPRDVIFGSVRVQALVEGSRIEEVTFLLDGEPQLTRTAPPFSVELDLPDLPRELVLRAEGRDADGELVAADETVLNQPRGELAVELVAPAAGETPQGSFPARARVTVPEGRRVETVSFRLNDEEASSVTQPPWESELAMPPGEELVFLTVTATLDDGQQAEAVRFLRDPYGGETVDVELVELYTTVVDRQGGLVKGLAAEDFEVWEDGRRQRIERFAPEADLPLTIGVVLDVSGSMHRSLREAQTAATAFLRAVVGPADQCFAVVFSSEPALLMPKTPDVGAVEVALEDVEAEGWTALHDAVVFGLYNFRGVRGRRALVVLSDGDDTDSRIEFGPALEYARSSGALVYTIGLKTDALDAIARDKLRDLARETGGRAFFISEARELADVYARIEEELRQQYLIAYAPDRPRGEGGFRQVEVRVDRRGAEARTIRGYVP